MQADRLFFGDERAEGRPAPMEPFPSPRARQGRSSAGHPRSAWALPLRLSADGSVREVRPDPVVDTARLILDVRPGERRLEPEFGCRLHLLPRLESNSLRQVAAALAEEAIQRWAPWLGVERIDVAAVEGTDVELVLRAGGALHRLRIRQRAPESAPRAGSAHGAAVVAGGENAAGAGGPRMARRAVAAEERAP